jgi:hypothetical protein
MEEVEDGKLEIWLESMIQIESWGLLTWVRPPGPMALVSLVYIRVKAHIDYGPR